MPSCPAPTRSGCVSGIVQQPISPKHNGDSSQSTVMDEGRRRLLLGWGGCGRWQDVTSITQHRWDRQPSPTENSSATQAGQRTPEPHSLRGCYGIWLREGCCVGPQAVLEDSWCFKKAKWSLWSAIPAEAEAETWTTESSRVAWGPWQNLIITRKIIWLSGELLPSMCKTMSMSMSRVWVQSSGKGREFREPPRGSHCPAHGFPSALTPHL